MFILADSIDLNNLACFYAFLGLDQAKAAPMTAGMS